MKALAWKIDPSQGWATVSYSWHPTISEWRQTIAQVFQDPSFQPGFGILLDLSEIAGSADTEFIRQMVREMDARSASGCVWAIVTRTSVAFGMARMAEQLSACNDRIRGFHSMAEATEWIRARSRIDT